MSYDFNLDTYSFQETLSLFNLSIEHDITEQDIQSAKSYLMKMHPDKSGLDPSYFLFYKKSFDIIVDKFKSQNSAKINAIVGCKDIKYDDKFDNGNEIAVSSRLKKIKSNVFLKKFNDLYESTMIDKEYQKSLENKNKWFTDTKPLDTTKEFAHTDITQYKPVQSAYHGSASNYFADVEDNSYVYCDPSSKLLYDDLRNAHLKESIISFKTDEIPNMNQISCENLRQQRINQDTQSITTEETLQYRMDIDEIERKNKRLMTLMKEDEFKTKNNIKKNSDVLSHFLNISN